MKDSPIQKDEGTKHSNDSAARKINPQQQEKPDEASSSPSVKNSPFNEDCNSDGGSSPRRSRPIPIVTTPNRGLSGASTSSDDDETDNNDGDDLDNSGNNNGVRIPSFHNSRGSPVQKNNSSDTSDEHSPPDTPPPNSTVASADQERQILLLMLLAQVCALHDPTPRTFTVHVLELFERGILGRQSIHFLFELGLVPPTTPRLLTNGTWTAAQSNANASHGNDSKEDILDLNQLTTLATTNKNDPTAQPTSPQTLRTQEASAIRNSLEQHDLAHRLQQQVRAGNSDGARTNGTPTATSDAYFRSNPNMVASPTTVESPVAAAAAASPSDDHCKASSWAVEHHPLSLSRYQREFHQVRLLNAGSFGEVFQSTNKVDLKDYAVKRVAFSAWGYSKDSVTQVIREVHCLAQCDHPNVVRYYTSWLEPSWMTGSGATMMMTSNDDNSAVEVRRQQKLLTDIQHMMLTGGAAGGGSFSQEGSSEYWGEPTNEYSLSPPSPSGNNHIQDFFQEQAGTLRNRKFSIGSSMDSFNSGGAESSYDETSTSEEEDEDVSAWTASENRGTTTREDSTIVFESRRSVEERHVTTTREDSFFFESRRKEVWESSSSPPRQQQHNNKKKQQQKSAAAAARLKYRYQICLFIQMQLCHPATLGDWIRHRNSQCDDPEQGRQERVETVVNIFDQIVGGLHHIHKKGIVHRDLKPANLFRSLEDESVFLIGDFGLSKLIHSATHHKKSKQQRQQSTSHPTVPHAEDTNQALVIHPPMTLSHANSATATWQDPLTAGVGTASYAAPEQVTTRTYGPKADIFSLGLILLEMLCCFTTEHERMQTFYDCRHRRDIPSWIAQEYPAAAKAILDCTDPNPSKRPTAENLLKVTCLLAPPAKPAALRAVDEVSSSEAKSDDTLLERLRCELQQKNVQLSKYEQKLEDKDRTIVQLRQELAQLRLTSQDVVQAQPMRGMGRDSFEVDEIASSSSSSDGV